MLIKFFKEFKTLNHFSSLTLEFFRLKHEGFETGQRVGLLLTIIGHVQDGNIAVLLTVSLEQGADDGSRHASKRHNIHDSAGTALREIDAFSDGKNGFAFEGGIKVGFGHSENRTRLGLTVVSEGALEKFFKMVLILLLVIVCEKYFQKVGQ